MDEKIQAWIDTAEYAAAQLSNFELNGTDPSAILTELSAFLNDHQASINRILKRAEWDRENIENEKRLAELEATHAARKGN